MNKNYLVFFLVTLLFFNIVLADNYTSFRKSVNISGNVTQWGSYVNISGNLTLAQSLNFTGANPFIYNGNSTWTNLYSYPVACPAGSFLTQLDDSVTCTVLTGVVGNFSIYNGSLNMYRTDGLLVNRLSNGSNIETVFNEQRDDIDFRIESDTNESIFFVDGENNRIGIQTIIPLALLHVNDYEGAFSNQFVISGAASGTAGFGLYQTTAQRAFMRFVGDSNTLVIDSDYSINLSTNNIPRVTFGTGDGVVFNEDSRDYDFRVESDGIANMFVIDAGTDAMGIGRAGRELTRVIIGGDIVGNETNLLRIDAITHTINTNVNQSRYVYIDAPTISGAFTVVNVSSFYISGAPHSAASATLTNNYSMFIDGGEMRTDGNIEFGGNNKITAADFMIGRSEDIQDSLVFNVPTTKIFNFTIDGVDSLSLGRDSLNKRSNVAGTANSISVQHFDNTNTASSAIFTASTSGSSAGDPYINFQITNGLDWSMGEDNSDSDKFKLSRSSGLGSLNIYSIDTNLLTTYESNLRMGSDILFTLGNTSNQPMYSLLFNSTIGTTVLSESAVPALFINGSRIIENPSLSALVGTDGNDIHFHTQRAGNASAGAGKNGGNIFYNLGNGSNSSGPAPGGNGGSMLVRLGGRGLGGTNGAYGVFGIISNSGTQDIHQLSLSHNGTESLITSGVGNITLSRDVTISQHALIRGELRVVGAEDIGGGQNIKCIKVDGNEGVCTAAINATPGCACS